MWKCHKCAKPVFFAERKQSLGYDWHPECLRCEECGKRLNPGQHAEHKGIPYCHVPCYGALFGPQLFGHGTRVESHKSFGHKEFIKPVNTPSVPRGHLETKLKAFNQYYDGKSGAIRSREVNGRLVLEGPLRIHWGVRGVIHLKEDDDQRMRVITVKKRSSCRYSNGGFSDSSNPDDEPNETKDIGKYEASEDQTVSTAKSSTDQAKVEIENLEKSELQTSQSVDSGIQSEMTSSIPTPPVSPAESKISATLPSKLDNKQMEWDELDELLQVERRIDESGKLYQTMPTSLPSQASVDSNNSDGHINSNIEVLNNNPPQVDTTMEVPPEESDGSVLDSADNTIKNPKMYTNTLSTEQYDELTLKPNTDLDIVNLLGKNELMPLDQDVLNRSSSDDTLKANSPIDPRKINDSLKLYGDLVRSASHDKVLAFGRCTLQHDCFEESLTMKPMRRVIIAHNRTLSVDSSVDRSGEELNNQSLNEYPLQRSVSGPESLKAADYEDSASDSETINYAHPVDDHIIVPGKGEVLVRCGKHNRTGSTAIRRRNGKRRQKAAVLRRRCSINGHFYDRETSFFTPPHGSLMSVWVTSLVSTSEVINLILDKYKVDAHAQRFALFIVRDNGEQRRLKDEEYPLITRVTLGPREDISKLFLMDADKTGEVSPEVAQFINLSSFECEAILRMYTAEENRELDRIRDRFFELRRRIKQRMEDLRVRL